MNRPLTHPRRGTDAARTKALLDGCLYYCLATVLRLLLANRRAMNSRSSGILLCWSSATALAGSDAAQGSVAYQYIRGRLWSLASSACCNNAVRMFQRFSTGMRCNAEAI